MLAYLTTLQQQGRQPAGVTKRNTTVSTNTVQPNQQAAKRSQLGGNQHPPLAGRGRGVLQMEEARALAELKTQSVTEIDPYDYILHLPTQQTEEPEVVAVPAAEEIDPYQFIRHVRHQEADQQEESSKKEGRTVIVRNEPAVEAPQGEQPAKTGLEAVRELIAEYEERLRLKKQPVSFEDPRPAPRSQPTRRPVKERLGKKIEQSRTVDEDSFAQPEDFPEFLE